LNICCDGESSAQFIYFYFDIIFQKRSWSNSLHSSPHIVSSHNTTHMQDALTFTSHACYESTPSHTLLQSLQLRNE
jgi:hypothetical protein